MMVVKAIMDWVKQEQWRTYIGHAYLIDAEEFERFLTEQLGEKTVWVDSDGCPLKPEWFPHLNDYTEAKQRWLNKDGE